MNGCDHCNSKQLQRPTFTTSRPQSEDNEDGSVAVWQMREACEPEEVIWKHLAANEEERARVRLRSRAVMFTLLLLNAIIYFWFKVHIMNATDEGLTNFASILSIGSALCLAAFAQLN
eukprot:873907-Prymnesium_polylepis.1